MVPGLCFQDKRFEFGAQLLAHQSEGARYHFQVLLATGRKVKVGQNKVVFSFQLDADPGDQQSMRRALEEFERRAAAEAEQVEFDLLWDSVAGRTLTLRELAAAWYGSEPGALHLAAMLKLALDNPMRFNVNGERVVAVDDATLQRRFEAKRQKEETRLLVEGALPIFEALAASDPAAAARLDGLPEARRFLDAIEQTLEGREPEHETDRGFLKRFWVGEEARERAIAALLCAGREVDLVGLTLRLRGVQTGFKPEVLEQAAALAATGLSGAGRRDLRDMLTFSIDSESTQDYDDALSVEHDGANLVVWVHIADAGDLIPRGSALDLAARERIATLYLPDRIHPMLPEQLCFDRLSLTAGRDRAALSFRLVFSDALELLEFEPAPSLVRVDRNLDFDDCAAALAAPEDELGRALVTLERLRKVLWAGRQSAGASVFPGIEPKISVDPDGRVHIELRDRDAPGSRLVEELMILANHRAARLCAEASIPSIFRVQEQRPDRRRAGPSVLTLDPGPHVGLGVGSYIQITSPIRRYPDLLMQRQISHFIEHRAPAYEDRSELLSLAKQAETELQSLREVEYEIKRFFTLVYFEQNREAEFTLRALKPLRDRPDFMLIEVEQTLFRFIDRLGPGVAPGTRWSARVEQVQPQTGRIEFRRVAAIVEGASPES